MTQSYIRVLGSADWHQTAYNDHSCYTICCNHIRTTFD